MSSNFYIFFDVKGLCRSMPRPCLLPGCGIARFHADLLPRHLLLFQKSWRLQTSRNWHGDLTSQASIAGNKQAIATSWLDPFHIQRGGGNVESIAKLTGDQIAVAHFMDTLGDSPREQRRAGFPTRQPRT